jgi:16S rRNA processing protein RimM
VERRRILLGVVGRPHGVRGLVRVHSYAADPASLAAYGELTDDRGRRFTLRWRGEGIAELAELADGKAVKVADRTAAERLVNTRLYVDRDRLPPPGPDEFYLADLVGLRAVTPEGRELGCVAAVHDYGAGASLEIGPLLVPFTRACVPEVDVAGGWLTVVPPLEIEVPEEAGPQRRAAS